MKGGDSGMISKQKNGGNLSISIDRNEKVIMIDYDYANVVVIIVRNMRTGKTIRRKLYITKSNKAFLN